MRWTGLKNNKIISDWAKSEEFTKFYKIHDCSIDLSESALQFA